MKALALLLTSLTATALTAQEPAKPAEEEHPPRRRVVLPTEEQPTPARKAQEPAKPADEEGQPRRRVVLPTEEQLSPAPAVTPEMEAAFTTTLTNAVFDGKFCMIENGRLGADKEEKYTIVSVEKQDGNNWVINARIQYGAINFTAPVPVVVKWAGDTPVIIVDNIGFPGTAKYSARVMVYKDTYAGTWSGGDHGGMMQGVITRAPAEEKKPAEKKD